MNSVTERLGYGVVNSLSILVISFDGFICDGGLISRNFFSYYTIGFVCADGLVIGLLFKSASFDTFTLTLGDDNGDLFS